MNSTYAQAMAAVYEWEGGYSNDAGDSGGPTNFGITIDDVRHYWKPNATAEDVKSLPKTVAADIYDKHYAAPVHYDELPAGVDLAVFDYGINSGIHKSAVTLQEIVGTPQDGVIGPATVAATLKADPVTVINAIYDKRLAYLKGLSIWNRFGNGWSTRCNEGRKLALSMADPTPVVVAPVASHDTRPVWPLQSQFVEFYGDPYAKSYQTDCIARVPCPWVLKTGKYGQSYIEINKKCAESLARVLNEIWERCGKDPTKISALKYDVFDGSFVLRPMRGSSQMSMHAGCAIDFDADENEFHGPKHTFTPDSIIVQAFERENWTWGGRWSTAGKDWMHFQAARVSTAAAVPMPPPIGPLVTLPPPIAPPKPAPIPAPAPTTKVPPVTTNTVPVSQHLPSELQVLLSSMPPALVEAINEAGLQLETLLLQILTAKNPILGFVLTAASKVANSAILNAEGSAATTTTTTTTVSAPPSPLSVPNLGSVVLPSLAKPVSELDAAFNALKALIPQH
jgi:lysozyme family protein